MKILISDKIFAMFLMRILKSLDKNREKIYGEFWKECDENP